MAGNLARRAPAGARRARTAKDDDGADLTAYLATFNMEGKQGS